MAKIDDSFNKSLSDFMKSYYEIIKNVQLPLPEIVETIQINLSKIDVPMKEILEKVSPIASIYSEFLNSEYVQKSFSIINKIIINTQNELTKIDTFSLNSSQIESIKNVENDLQEFDEIVKQDSSKSMTWEQWLLIIGFIIQIISTIKDFLPNDEFEILQSQVNEIIEETQNYHHRSLENQALYLDNQDKMIENQEQILQNQQTLIDLQQQLQDKMKCPD